MKRKNNKKIIETHPSILAPTADVGRLFGTDEEVRKFENEKDDAVCSLWVPAFLHVAKIRSEYLVWWWTWRDGKLIQSFWGQGQKKGKWPIRWIGSLLHELRQTWHSHAHVRHLRRWSVSFLKYIQDSLISNFNYSRKYPLACIDNLVSKLNDDQTLLIMYDIICLCKQKLEVSFFIRGQCAM